MWKTDPGRKASKIRVHDFISLSPSPFPQAFSYNNYFNIKLLLKEYFIYDGEGTDALSEYDLK